MGGDLLELMVLRALRGSARDPIPGMVKHSGLTAVREGSSHWQPHLAVVNFSTGSSDEGALSGLAYFYPPKGVITLGSIASHLRAYTSEPTKLDRSQRTSSSTYVCTSRG